MTLQDNKSHYGRFLRGHQGKVHFAAHSHHFWPDVSREGHLNYWDDCALSSDAKWEKIFSEVIPRGQQIIAEILNLKDPGQITFAPNTHELAARILSLFLGRKSFKVLTTSSEFHSWRRQLLRLEEIDSVEVTAVDTKDFLDNRQLFLESLRKALAQGPDLFFLSQVFFDSGLALRDEELMELVTAAPKHTLIVVDGYHGFAAIPTDLSALEGRVFYLGGGYKYAQAGEGVGFLVVPKGFWRPAFTGWFAEFTQLDLPPGQNVGYAEDARSFLGATQDFSGIYRFNAVWDHFQNLGWDVPAIHRHVRELQLAFIAALPPQFLSERRLRPIFTQDLHWHGHFLTFEAPDENVAEETLQELSQVDVLVDRRAQKLRFGFGTYHDLQDIQVLVDSIGRLIS